MKNELIKECEGIIYSIANKYKNGYNFEDLYQAGCVGVIKAYRNFEGSLNVKFSTYAYNYILGEIIDYIRNDRNIKISSDYYDIYRRYKKTRELLCKSYNREVSFFEIASFMDIDEYKLASIIERTAFTKTLEDDNVSYIEDNNKFFEKILLDSEIDSLEEPMKSIIRYRYYYGMSQQETALSMEMSQATVSREENNALKLMKRNIA